MFRFDAEKSVHFCDGMRRRDFLHAGSLGLLGLTGAAAASLLAGSPGHGARTRALAELLLERYGVVTRETVLAEGVPGGFSALYGELTNLETLGTARRGYFVEGLGGAQFALPAAIERLRTMRTDEPAAPQDHTLLAHPGLHHLG